MCHYTGIAIKVALPQCRFVTYTPGTVAGVRTEKARSSPLQARSPRDRIPATAGPLGGNARIPNARAVGFRRGWVIEIVREGVGDRTVAVERA